MGNLQQVPPGTSQDYLVGAINQIVDYLNAAQKTETLYDATGNKIVQLSQGQGANPGLTIYDTNGIPLALFGKYPDGTIALKVAKPNIDVTKATNDQLIFNSSQNGFKIVKTLNVTCPAITLGTPGAGTFLSGTNNNAVPHGLGYTPAVLAFINEGGQYFPLPSISNSGTSTHGSWITYQISADATNIYPETDLLVYGTSGNNAPAQNVLCYLLQETANATN